MNLESKYIELLEKIEAFAVTEGQELVLASIQIEALSNIVFAVAWLIIAIFSVRYLKNTVPGFDADDTTFITVMKIIVAVMKIIVPVIFAIVGTLFSFAVFFDVWLYVALIKPELWLIHTIIR